MNINELFNEEKILETKLNYYISKKIIIKEGNDELVIGHLDKTEHNLRFFQKNYSEEEFEDWLIVILYYALYHSCLALLANKGYISKNHNATLIFLIKEYGFERKDIELIEELSITKKDAEFYTEIKSGRQESSYSTKKLFSREKVKRYKKRVNELIIKIKEIIVNS